MSSIEGRETTPPQTSDEKQREFRTKAKEIIRSNQKADKIRNALEVIKSVFSRA